MRRLLLLLLAPIAVDAATRYCAPDGTDSGDALTRATAWQTPDYAGSNSSAMASGDTLVFIYSKDGGTGVAVWDSTGGANPPLGSTWYKGGTKGDWLCLKADEGSTIIFDGSSLAAGTRAFLFQNQSSRHTENIALEGLWFRDYYDTDGADNGIPTATIWMGNQQASGVEGGLIVRDCRFYASAPQAGQYIDGGVQVFGTSAGYEIDTLIVGRCSYDLDVGIVTVRLHYDGDTDWQPILEACVPIAVPNGSGITRYTQATLICGLRKTTYDPGGFSGSKDLYTFTGNLWVHNADWTDPWSPIS